MPLQKAPPAEGEMKQGMVSAGNPSGSFHSPPPFAQGRLSPLGDYKLSPPGRRAHQALQKAPPRRQAPTDSSQNPFPFSPRYAWIAKKPSDCFPFASGQGAGIRRDPSGAFVRPWKKRQKPGRFRRTLLLDRPGPAAIIGNRGGEKYGPFEPGKQAAVQQLPIGEITPAPTRPAGISTRRSWRPWPRASTAAAC